MLMITMLMMMIRMPRYYEGNQEEEMKEVQVEGVRHWRLFLVVIIIISVIFIMVIIIVVMVIIITTMTTIIVIMIMISGNSISIINNKSTTVGVLLLLCLMWSGEDLPTNGFHFWPLWTSAFVASVILNDEDEDDDHHDQCNADSAYCLLFWKC